MFGFKKKDGGKAWKDLRLIEDHRLIEQIGFDELVGYLNERGCRIVGFNPARLYDLYNGVAYRMLDEEIVPTLRGMANECPITAFLNELDIWKLGGQTPLDRLAEVIQLLIRQARENGEAEEGAYPIPLLMDGLLNAEEPKPVQRAVEAAQVANEMIRLVGHLDPRQCAFLAKHAGLALTDYIGRRFTDLDDRTLELLRDIARISAVQLNGRKKQPARTEVRKSRKGGKTELSRMRSWRQMNQVPMAQRFLPGAEEKVLTRKAQVRERVLLEQRKESNKQVFFVLVDDSGSMSAQDKIDYVRLILLHLMQKVVDEEAILYVSTFESELDGFSRIEDEVDAEYLLDHFFGFNRGITEIANVVYQVCRDFEQNEVMMESGRKEALEKGTDYQLLVINDGQDGIDPDFEAPFPVHAVCLFQENRDLEQVCRHSGGEYHAFGV